MKKIFVLVIDLLPKRVQMNGFWTILASPVARVTTASAAGINLTDFCWTKNEDFLNTQSDLWIEVVNAFKDDDRVGMALPQQEIHIVNERTA